MRLKSSRDHELVLEWKITTNKENKYERWSKIKVKNKLSQRKINYIAKSHLMTPNSLISQEISFLIFTSMNIAETSLKWTS